MPSAAAALTPEQQALAAVLQAFQAGATPQAVGDAPNQAEHHKRKRELRAAAQPLLSPRLNEPLLSFFERLKPLAAQHQELKLVDRDQALGEDGIYLHKRPAAGSDGPGSILALAGTVLHHVVLYIKAGNELHKLDYGPLDGSDLTTNLTASAPCRTCLAPGASIPTEDTLPLLYLGPCNIPLGSPTVAQALRFAESRQYNAVHNNCIHFADFIIRVLTGGRLASAPLLYDALAGGLPDQEPVILAMMPLIMGATWFQAVDGSPVYQQFFTATRNGEVEELLPGGSLVHSSSTDSLPHSKRQETAEQGSTGSRVGAKDAPEALDARLEASNNAAGL